MLLKDRVSVMVVYASQQGNAQAIAEDLHEELEEHLKEANVFLELNCISKIGKDPSLFSKTDCAVFIASTTGDGDPPDTARKLWRTLNKSKPTQSKDPKTSNSPAGTDQINDSTVTLNQEKTISDPSIRNADLDISKFLNTSEKVDISTEKVDDSSEKVHNPPEKVDISLEERGNDVADFVEPVDLSSEQLSQPNKSGLDATNGETNEVSNFSSEPEETSITTDTNESTNTSTKTAACINEMGKDVIDHKIDLSHLTYTVLGLGDTNYTNFCNFGKNLDEILHRLGAQRFYPCGWADDGTGLEIVIEPWKEKFWKAITEHVAELTKKKQARTALSASQALANVNDRISESKVEMTLGENVALIESNLSKRSYIADEEEKNVSAKLKNLHLNDLESWRLNHPLLRLELTPETKLTLPKIPTLDTIALTYSNESSPDDYTICYQNGAFLPSAKSGILNCCVVDFKHLSCTLPNKPVKKVVEIFLQLKSEDDLDYEPGDSVAILPRNNPRDVDLVLQRLSVSPDKMCRLMKNPTAKKQLPPHLPTCSSLKEIFTTCVDIRCVPKKALLLQFLSCCTDPHEIRCLQELVSREGSDFYVKKVLEDQITFLDMLFVFRSCQFEVPVLLEVLPRLLPRAYSLTSSPLSNTKELSFVYSLAIIPGSNGRFEERKGICTGLLDSLDLQKSADPIMTIELALYLRSSQSFRLPRDHTKPIIMIGPGTGVAPFIGFLRHRKHHVDQKVIDLSELGESWLFFGCRFREADDLFKDEINNFVDSKILTNFYSCYSREHELQPMDDHETKNRKYVQDLVRLHSLSLVSAITERDAVVYVCGDARNMAKDVYSTFSLILTEYFGDESEGLQYLSQMQKDKRYLQDVWT